MIRNKDVIMKFIRKERGSLSNDTFICAYGQLFLNSINVAHYEDNEIYVRINKDVTDERINEVLTLLDKNHKKYIYWDFSK